MGNGPPVLVDAFARPPLVIPRLLVVPTLLVVPLPLVLPLPFVELMLRITIAPFGATIPLVIKT